jgi:hypothetical protein
MRSRSAPLLPCVVCFSAADPVVRDSVNAGVFVLLGVTLLVLTGILAFLVGMMRRARANDRSAAPVSGLSTDVRGGGQR